MSDLVEQRLQHIAVQLEELRFWVYRAFDDLEGWTLDGEPIPVGSAWWPQTATGRVVQGYKADQGLSPIVVLERHSIRVPSHWRLEESHLALDPGGEALLHISYADGNAESFGVGPWHREFPLRSREFDVRVEAVARFPFGAPNREPRLKMSRLVWIDVEVERLHRRLWLAYKSAVELGSDQVVPGLIDTMERVLAAITWPSQTGDYLARIESSRQMQEIWQLPRDLPRHPRGLDEFERDTVRNAACLLDGALADLRKRHPARGLLAVTGHAHIDLAWLWPIEETRRKARRTFSTVVALMDRYPELRFNQSSAQIYAFLEQDDPPLFREIQRRARIGQWEPVGGMWVEPDLNMPTGESLVRQLLYGQRFFRDTFGAVHDTCWVPDCFGFTPALPQLLRQAGIENFFTIKLTWSETNRFPYDLFWWEGLDGSRVLVHMFDNPGHDDLGTSGYNGDPSPRAAVATWRNFRGKDLHDESLLSIGYGDGGGGMTFEMAEWMREMPTLPSVPALRYSTVSDFYSRLRTAVADKAVPVWSGELYLELHRGTLTTQGRTKYLHRRAEQDLIAAEVVSSLALLSGEGTQSTLEDAWKILLRNQFHDILPGSSIREVYERANGELATVVDRAGGRIQQAMAALSRKLITPGDRIGLLCVNPDLCPRPLRVELPERINGFQETEEGCVLAGDERIPGLGARIFTSPMTPGSVSVSTSHMENDLLRVELDSAGTLSRVYDKRLDREVLAAHGNQIWAYVDKPRNWDAWDIEGTYARDGYALDDVESIDVVETGPHRVAVRILRVFRHSRITQDVRLWSNSARIEFKTTIDWHDRHWLVKALFPLKVRSERATFETAFGVVERPTHRNTSWEQAKFEVAAHRFADLSEPGYGVALLNDGKYGHHAIGNQLGISLLRSPVYPDPLADEGVQTFIYALFPHLGTWLEGGVLMEAEDLNRPLLVIPIQAMEDRTWRPIQFAGTTVALAALKPAEDDPASLILRVYEPTGARGPVSIEPPDGWEVAGHVDLLESLRGSPEYYIRPFELKSYLLRRSGSRGSSSHSGTAS